MRLLCMCVVKQTLSIGLVLLVATLPQAICGVDGGLWGLLLDSAGVVHVSHDGSGCQQEETLDNCPCENSLIHQTHHAHPTLQLVSPFAYNGYPPILFQAHAPLFRPPIGS